MGFFLHSKRDNFGTTMSEGIKLLNSITFWSVQCTEWMVTVPGIIHEYEDALLDCKQAGLA